MVVSPETSGCHHAQHTEEETGQYDRNERHQGQRSEPGLPPVTLHQRMPPWFDQQIKRDGSEKRSDHERQFVQHDQTDRNQYTEKQQLPEKQVVSPQIFVNILHDISCLWLSSVRKPDTARPQRSRRTHNRPKDRENLPAAVRKYDRTKYLPNRLHFSGMHSIFASRIQKAGCSSVRLECWSGGPKVAGSSPVTPTNDKRLLQKKSQQPFVMFILT